MEKIKKLLLFPICLFSLVLLNACEDKIVVNNAFIYLVHEDCIGYGSIYGEQWQSVFVGEYSLQVTALPVEGCHFIKWSDGLETPSRSDLAINENDRGPVVYYAYFEVVND